MTGQYTQRELLQNLSTPIHQIVEETDAQRRRRLRWRSQHDTLWTGSRVENGKKLYHTEYSSSNLQLLNVTWKDTGNPLKTGQSGCWRYTFGIKTIALCPTRKLAFGDEMYDYRLDNDDAKLYTELEVRPKIEGQHETNPFIDIAPRRTPNHFQFLHGHNLTKKIRNTDEDLGFESFVNHIASLKDCPERLTSNRARNIWPLATSLKHHQDGASILEDGLLPTLYSFASPANGLASASFDLMEQSDDLASRLPFWFGASSVLRNILGSMLAVPDLLLSAKGVYEAADELYSPAPDAGSDNKLRFWERFPPHNGDIKYGPITGGFLLFDAYVTPNSKEKATSRDDQVIFPKIDVTVRNRFKNGGAKSSTDRLSSPTWTVAMDTPEKVPDKEMTALSGATLVGVEDMRNLDGVDPDDVPTFNTGPNPSIRDLNLDAEDIRTYAVSDVATPVYTRNEQVSFDATDTAVHRSTEDISPPKWSVWKDVYDCNRFDCPEHGACGPTPTASCVKNHYDCWKELPKKQATGWRYDTSFSEPGDYKIEATIDGNTTDYKFTVGHTPIPSITKPKSDLTQQLVGEPILVEGETAYEGERQLGKFWVMPEHAFCADPTKPAPDPFTDSQLGKPNQSYKATVGSQTSISMAKPGVWQLYYFVVESDKDQEGECETHFNGDQVKPLPRHCQWNVSTVTIISLGHSTPIEHNLVTDISFTLDYNISAPRRSRSGTLTTEDLATDPLEEESRKPSQFKDERVIDMRRFESIEVDISNSTAPGPREILGYRWDLNNDGKFVNLQSFVDNNDEAVLQGVLGDNALKLPQDDARFTESQLMPVRFMVFALNTEGGRGNNAGKDQIEARVGEFVLEVGHAGEQSAAIEAIPRDSSAVSEYLQATFGSADPPMISDETMFFTARDSGLASDATAFRWKFESGYLDAGHLDAIDGGVGDSNIAWDVATDRPGPVFYDYDFSGGKDSFELLLQVVYPNGDTATERVTITEDGVTTDT